MNLEGLEFVQTLPSLEHGKVECIFVRYEPGARTGRFHHYVTKTLTLEEFEALTKSGFKTTVN